MTQYASSDFMAPQRPRTSGTAVTSLVLGLLLCIPFVSGLLAIIFGLVGLGATGKAKMAGRGLAIAGLILGLVNIAGWGTIGATVGAAYQASKPGRAVARQFLVDLSANNVDGALRNSAPSITRGTLEKQASDLQKLGAFNQVTFAGFNMRADTSGTSLQLTGVAQFAQGQKFCIFQLVKLGNTFKVSSAQLQ